MEIGENFEAMANVENLQFILTDPKCGVGKLISLPPQFTFP